MTTRARLTLYAALATGLAMLGLTPLLRPSGWVQSAGLLIVVVALVGAGLRRLATARPLIVLAQLVVVCYLLLLGSVGGSFTAGVLPGPGTLSAFNNLLTAAGNDISSYAIPAPATAGLRFLLIAAVALVAVAVDALAVTYRKAAPAGLPLLALYSVGTGLAGSAGGASWLWFLAAGGGYLMLLFAEGRDRLSRWGRVFRGAGAPESRDGLPTGGHRIGVIALACALLLPVLAPNWDLSLVNGGFGDGGSGSGNGSINALNPVVSLTDGLRRPDNQELIQYHGDDPALATAYLRITALDEFNGVEWKPGNQSAETVPSTMPRPTGLGSDVATSPMDTQIQISSSLSTDWLPAPYPISRVDVSGNWRFEPDVGAVIGDRGQKATGLNYTVTSLDVMPTADQLRAAPPAPGSITDHYTKLPANLPAVVKQLALQVTNGRSSDYDKAVALQDWFTTTGGFVYSSSVDPGTGPTAIATFLQDRKGFCVHFAATMAAMARTLGIPARVAVGFAPGADQGNGNYVVGSKDYHAWPELYFSGAGWMRFEPTPSRGVAPDYSGPQVAPSQNAPTEQPSARADAPAQSAPSADSSCGAPGRRQGGCGQQEPQQLPTVAAPASGGLSGQVLGLIAAGAAVLLLLLSPMLWRARLRRRRLGGGRRGPGGPGGQLTDEQVLAAWAELIDTAWDLGIPPDQAHSPRHTGERISLAADLDEPGRAAVGRVALATEQVLYAREAGPQPALGSDVRTVHQRLRASAGRGQRLRAALLPPSAARLVWRLSDRMLSARLRGQAARRRLAGALGRPLSRLRRRRRDQG
ncbi:transglutaminaseTgpA domain-containing protein [Kitasatospora sp. NPDC008050]|uniref:transglutaminase family protein n=1 Tax=Kitasatospora sp. NPDC008050 TaxID=3364021 RepID=UPI0036E9E871